MSRPIKVSSYCSYIAGGAGGSSLKLHMALKKEGVESRLYTKNIPYYATNEQEGVYKLEGSIINSQISRVPANNNNGFNIVASGYGCGYFSELESTYKKSDIILLRWVTDFISDFQISSWSNRNKPVIWCLSDMAPFTGGCHYSFDCDGYKDNCSKCPMVKKGLQGHPSLTMQRRQSLWENITLVSPSKWLASCARESTIFNKSRIEVIQTGVELDIFKPVKGGENSLIKQLDLSPEKKYILFGADYQDDPRKGGSYLPEIFEELKKLLQPTEKVVVVFLGNVNTDSVKLPQFEVLNLNFVKKKEILAEVYSFVDLTVLPYVQDNLPNMMLESIACGTPVVAFDTGGIKDVLVEGVNGKKIPLGSCKDMAMSIYELLKSPLPVNFLREYAESNLDIRLQARKYVDLFSKLLI